MNAKDFLRLGIPLGEATRRATDFVSQFVLSGGDKTKLEEELKAIMANPARFAEDPMRKELAKAIVNAPPPPRAEPVKYRQWGEGLEHEAVMQMEKASLLPVAVAVDVGVIRTRGWAVIECNAAFGAGIYGCDPLEILRVLRCACALI
jgi:hypothetical protein